MISATILYRNAWGGRKVVTKDFVDRGHLDNYLNKLTRKLNTIDEVYPREV